MSIDVTEKTAERPDRKWQRETKTNRDRLRQTETSLEDRLRPIEVEGQTESTLRDRLRPIEEADRDRYTDIQDRYTDIQADRRQDIKDTNRQPHTLNLRPS